PFRYQGQYFDDDLELCYNRFRYYSPDTGMYISQDPIGVHGNNPNLYGYVWDSNSEVDIFGLSCTQVHHIIPNAVYKYFRKDLKKIKGFVQAKAHKNAKTRTNLIDLETPFHGNHPKYNDFVKGRIQKLKDADMLNFDNISKLQNELRDKIGDALESGKTLNQYFGGLL
ncbi:RHS repeat-associated core domain-containing protein, partial [Cellulophaga lytica]|uniref:RHS repeat-associated core domain-containing protein n=1 Tax=Cellulophaga lytica TaxID=979 RepID=UPI0026E3CC30